MLIYLEIAISYVELPKVWEQTCVGWEDEVRLQTGRMIFFGTGTTGRDMYDMCSVGWILAAKSRAL